MAPGLTNFLPGDGATMLHGSGNAGSESGTPTPHLRNKVYSILCEWCPLELCNSVTLLVTLGK